MNAQVKAYMDGYPARIIDLFDQLRQIVLDSAACQPEEVLWAKLPSYCVQAAFVRLIPFKDHINIEAQAVLSHRAELPDYKITPKGMLQLYPEQPIPAELLKQIFQETFAG